MPDPGEFSQAIMGGGGAPPGAGPPGGAPPPGGPAGPGGPGGPPGGGPGGPPGGGQADPIQRIQAALTLLTISMSEIGLTETANKAVQTVVRAVTNLTKNNPQGRQGAVMQGAVPPSGPPGAGQMPGSNVA